MSIQKLLEDFWLYIEKTDIEIYNEFSFQHELGIYLRNILKDFKIEFERNVSKYNDRKIKTIKREIDIVIISPEGNKYAIELKYPRHGQYPVRMFKFIEDIVFMEQIKEIGFMETFTMVVVDKNIGKNFYEGNIPEEKIYKYFRKKDGKVCCGIKKGKYGHPTSSKKDITVEIKGNYNPIEWKEAKNINCAVDDGNGMYYIIKTNNT